MDGGNGQVEHEVDLGIIEEFVDALCLNTVFLGAPRRLRYWPKVRRQPKSVRARTPRAGASIRLAMVCHTRGTAPVPRWPGRK